MLHIDDPEIRNLLLEGKFGLEKEGLRVYEDASMAHTPHPFPHDSHITCDFSENQTEIRVDRHIRKTDSSLPFRNGLITHAQFLCKLLLCHP